MVLGLRFVTVSPAEETFRCKSYKLKPETKGHKIFISPTAFA